VVIQSNAAKVGQWTDAYGLAVNDSLAIQFPIRYLLFLRSVTFLLLSDDLDAVLKTGVLLQESIGQDFPYGQRGPTPYPCAARGDLS